MKSFRLNGFVLSKITRCLMLICFGTILCACSIQVQPRSGQNVPESSSATSEPKNHTDQQSLINTNLNNTNLNNTNLNNTNLNNTNANVQQSDQSTATRPKIKGENTLISQKAISNDIWLKISRDFGTQAIQTVQDLPSKNESNYIQWMRSRLKMTTAYGGSFVESIAGITSGYSEGNWLTLKKMDWFFYVNGHLSDYGAGDVKVQAGDRIVWDYHQWTEANPAQTEIIGAFPQPFSDQKIQQPICIIGTDDLSQKELNKFSDWFAQQTNKQINLIQNQKQFTSIPSIESIQDAPQLWIGTWSQIQNVPALQSVFDDPDQYGLVAEQEPIDDRHGWMQVIRGKDPNAQPIWLIVLQSAEDLQPFFESFKQTAKWQGWFALDFYMKNGKPIIQPLQASIAGGSAQ